MPVFLYHPQNAIGKKLKEAFEEDGFIYMARPHMEAILKDKIAKAGIDITPGFYMHLGPMSGLSLYETINKYMELDPDNAMHKQIINHFKQKKEWAFVKLNNGPKMKCVIGYCNSDPSTPFLMTSAQQAQAGIINSTFVPR